MCAHRCAHATVLMWRTGTSGWWLSPSAVGSQWNASHQACVAGAFPCSASSAARSVGILLFFLAFRLCITHVLLHDIRVTTDPACTAVADVDDNGTAAVTFSEDTEQMSLSLR